MDLKGKKVLVVGAGAVWGRGGELAFSVSVVHG